MCTYKWKFYLDVEKEREDKVSKKLKIRASSFSFLKSNLIRHVRTEQSFDETWIFMGKS